MKILVGQINTTVGALEGNAALIESVYRQGAREGADIVMVPELAVTGYPPRDLLENRFFVEANLAIRDRLVAMTGRTALIFGCVEWSESREGKALYNSAIVASEGRLVHRQAKSLLPTYDVFDELRYFDASVEPRVCELFGKKIGVSICEDYWFDDELNGRRLYASNPIAPLAAQGAELLLNISASPFNAGKHDSRHRLFREIARRYEVPLVYCNQVGGCDELVFDGGSIAMNGGGETVWCARPFQSVREMVDLDSDPIECASGHQPAEITEALILGIRDYAAKCGFREAALGLSGGIDSAVTAALAVEALGKSRVTGFAMPAPFTSEQSLADAEALARNLGIRYSVEPIGEIYRQYRSSFDRMFGDQTFGIADENIQARIRGNLLMAWSNRTGGLILTTGNKSELAVGYCTLYGDMAGGLCVLGDVYKTMVYELAAHLNRDEERIPPATIVRPPTAELRPNQTDQDSLPPYEVLDAILALYIERHRDADAIIASGHGRRLVERILDMVDRAEFKRRQAPPTLRVTTKAFGSGRQIPIAQQWSAERWRFIR
ncbi:MAG: NAD+ synthase [Thermoanaerobaculia bacterium]